MLKRCVLAVMAAVVAVTWSQTGQAQAPCLIERGQDPLDVLNTGVRHNVWIILDASGSMGQDFVPGGDSKLEVAKEVLNQLIDELVDASGRPLVNWAYARYAKQVQEGPTSTWPNLSGNFDRCDAPDGNEWPDNDGDGYPDTPRNCHGLQDGSFVAPAACGENNSEVVKAEINGTPREGGTPIGVAFTDMADYIVGQHASNSFDFVTNLLPGQKNFIIHLTDGAAGCECNDYGYDLHNAGVVPDDEITMRIGGDRAGGGPQTPTSSTSSGETRAYNAGLKGYVALRKIDPNGDGSKGNVFVVGMGLDADEEERTNTVAWMASGAHTLPPRDASLLHSAFFADNPQQLVDSFSNILAKIGVPTAEVSLGSSIVGTVREVIPPNSTLRTTSTNPFLTAGDHIGDVGPVGFDADDVREARKVRSNHQSNVLFSTFAEVPGFKGHLRAHNIYEVTDNLNPRTQRQADFTQIWDAGELLQQRVPSDRNILFNRKDETLLRPFDTATAQDLDVQAGFLGAKTDDDARDMVVKVVQGFRLSIHSSTETFYKPDGKTLNFSEFEADGTTRTWKLYDAVAAPAIVVNPPRSPDFDPPQNHAAKWGVGGTKAGEGFYWDHFNRRTMVYLPSNGGMMHAFEAETGEELFAYIPDDVMRLDSGEVVGSRDTLADFVKLVVAENNGVINHQYFLSSPATVREVFLRSDVGAPAGDDEWHTILAFGRGRGGRFVTGLDITDPLVPLLRFNRGNREGISDGDYDGLGETWSSPVMGNVLTDPIGGVDRVDQSLAFFGGGYGCNDGEEGRYLFAVRLEDGLVYHRAKVTSDSSAPIPNNALVAMPRLYNPHQEDVADNRDYVTRAYIGDVQGNIWKLDTLAVDPNNWSFEKFAELGTDQPITVPVALLKDLNSQRIFVLAGTGGDLRVDALTTIFKFLAFVDTDPDGANTTPPQYPLGTPAEFEFALNAEERVYVAPLTIGTLGDPNQDPPVVFFAATRTELDTSVCKTRFFSTLFALGVESGQAAVDLDGGGYDESIDLGETKVTGLYARDGNLYVSGGIDTTHLSDGSLSAELATSGGTFQIQMLIEGFRLSPF